MKSRYASKRLSDLARGFAAARAVATLTGVLAIAGALAPTRAEAYATYIRHEYVTCVACHQSPRGGGMLTPYGRGIGASQAFFAREYEPVDLSKSRFQRLVSAGGRVDHGALVRLLGVAQPGGERDLFLMQAD